MATDIRETRARKAAARQGMILMKAYARDKKDRNYGLFLLANAGSNTPVFPSDGEFTTLGRIEAYLSRVAAGNEAVTRDEARPR